MKLFTYIFALFTVGTFASCNMLDIDESTGTPGESIFELTNRTAALLTNIYTYLPSDFNAVNGTSRSCATDDAEYVWDNMTLDLLNKGTWSPIKTADAQWSGYYTAIRACNYFLENFSLKALDKWQYQTNYNDIKTRFINYQHEARFLRAFYHFELTKRYGDIPLGDRLFTESDVNTVKRTAFIDVIQFIVDECDAVMKFLPVTYMNMPGAQETGRATKGTAMALKTKALLYAASPLHNPENNIDRWKSAALAAKVLIDSAEIRKWYALPNNVFDTNVINSKELIFESREGAANYYEKANYPMGYEGGNTGICPSQNLVDAFEMTLESGGGVFDWNNDAHRADPFINRDQRLAKTVLHDKATFKNTTIDIAENGVNGLPQTGATKTGYYVRKFLIETINLTPSNTTTSIHTWPIFRYADILLMYAEAMNEAFPNSTTYKDNTYTYSAEWAINKVRERAKIAPVNGLPYDTFKEKVQNERRVELAFEDSRFWDIRRWKIGAQTTIIYGTKIAQLGASRIYIPNQVVATRYWNDRMNLYPIPASERFINTNLTQNAGW